MDTVLNTYAPSKYSHAEFPGLDRQLSLLVSNMNSLSKNSHCLIIKNAFLKMFTVLYTNYFKLSQQTNQKNFAIIIKVS